MSAKNPTAVRSKLERAFDELFDAAIYEGLDEQDASDLADRTLHTFIMQLPPRYTMGTSQ